MESSEGYCRRGALLRLRNYNTLFGVMLFYITIRDDSYADADGGATSALDCTYATLYDAWAVVHGGIARSCLGV